MPQPRAGHSLHQPKRSTQDFEFWRKLVRKAVRLAPTPFFVFSIDPIREALDELSVLEKAVPIPVRHWLSCKTQPVRPLLRWWQAHGYGIEVVSDFELRAALAAGFIGDRILVNGPAKHRWLPQHAIPELRVNFDSLTEVPALLPMAKKLNWSLGIRCHTTDEHESGDPSQPTQFGMEPGEAVRTLRRLRGAPVETLHFHLGTNIPGAAAYGRALQFLASICQEAKFSPKYIDCGGGLPPPHTRDLNGHSYNSRFHLAELGRVYCQTLRQFPSVRELWFENGRFISARSGVLVVRIHDTKEKAGIRQVICDGGRTLNALISTWETHDLMIEPLRRGPLRQTAVYGPTCMAYDRLPAAPLPATLRRSDLLIWMDAGAYHIPWETQFSHGLAAVLWHDEQGLKLARPPHSFDDWWNRWSG